MKTTKRHFRLFKKEGQYWVARLGLQGWQIAWEHKQHDDDSRAGVYWKQRGRVATIRLSPSWGSEKPTDSLVQRCAFHEACELLLARLNCMADGTVPSHDNDVIEETHNIIRTLENVFWEPQA